MKNEPVPLTAAEALNLALDNTHPDHVLELSKVLTWINIAAQGGQVEIEIPQHLRPSVKAWLQGKSYWVHETQGRGGKFTTINYESELDNIIKSYQDANKSG